MRIEVVADLRDAPPAVAAELVRGWAAEDRTGELIAAATFALAPEALAACADVPPRWRMITGPTSHGLWNASLLEAGRAGRPVAALLAPVPPACDAVGVMLELLATDPMFGAAAARLQCWEGCCVQTVPPVSGGAPPEWIPLAALAHTASHELIGEMLAGCIVLAPLLLTDFGDVDPPFESLAGAVVHRLIAGRRCGLRTVLANRAVVRAVGAGCGEPAACVVRLPSVDASRLDLFGAEIDRAWHEFRGASNERLEKLTGHLLRAAAGACRPTLLLDMRNVRATYNGTTFAAMGAAWGLHQSATGWDVSVLAHPTGAAYHDFESAFPGWAVHTSAPSKPFDVALRLSQPWHVQEMIDLHLAARINACLMLDSIAWDVLYLAPPHLDGTWRFLGASADGILFISEFSRRRFCARFPSAPGQAHGVAHLSFDPRDYRRQELIGATPGDYILVVGNQLDHKDVGATVRSLASAFPFEEIEVLGPSPVRSPRVRTHTSGNLAEQEVHSLYASAKLVVFPSFYEGFGFPVVTALAYGRTLFARESPLLLEVAAQCPPGGRLIPYRQRDDLVDVVGRLQHGEPIPEVRVGTGLNGTPPRSWRQVGLEIDTFLRSLMADASPASWRARDALVSLVMASRS